MVAPRTKAWPGFRQKARHCSTAAKKPPEGGSWHEAARRDQSARRREASIITSPKPAAISAQVPGSGTAVVW
jgi:hypothetical protein